MKKSSSILLLTLCLGFTPAIAQNKWLVEAQKSEAKLDKVKAAKFYWKAVEHAGIEAEVYAKAGQFFLDNNFFKEAEQTYEKAQVRVGKQGDFTIQLIKAYILNHNLNKANALLFRSKNKYVKGHPLLPEVEKLERDINFQIQLKPIDSATSVWPINLGADVNTKVDEYFPSIHGNDEELIFTRKTNHQDEDFYVAYRDTSCLWSGVAVMGYPLNSSKNEGAHFLSMDRKYMFFMRCGNQRTNESTMGNCDMYLAFKKKGAWSESEPFGATINTPYYDGTPCLASDNKHLYFASDKPGGFGGKDIYVTKFEDGLWQLPENLGSAINTPFDDYAPFLALDDHTLYFTSNGHPGFGGSDIFVAHKLNNGQWSKPVNLGATINSSYNELSLVVHPSGDKAYFASDRKGGYGGFDLYEINLASELQPQKMTILYGKVYDTFSDQSLNSALIELIDLEDETKQYKAVSNYGDASYYIPLPIGKPLLRRVFRFGYQEAVDTILLMEQKMAAFEQLDIKLLPDGYEEPTLELALTKVNFMKNQLHVPEEILNNIIEQLKDFNHPDFTIQIYGFTDNTGTPFINEDYSYRRSQIIADALIAAGISEDKLEVRGWGDANPIVENDTDEHRDMNRRVEIKVIGKEQLFTNMNLFQSKN